MTQDQGASAKADRAATPSEPSQSSVVSGVAGIPCAFTPGPWRTDYAGGYGQCGFYAGETLLGTASQVGTGEDRIDVAEANARLIASAPDMFDVLKLLLATPWDDVSGMHGVCDAAEAALAKARGQ